MRVDLARVAAKRRGDVEVAAEPRPAGEPVTAGDDQLRVGELQVGGDDAHTVGVVAPQQLQRAWVPRPGRPLQAAGVAAEPFEGRVAGQGRGHDGLLSCARCPLRRAERRSVLAECRCSREAEPLPADRGRPGTPSASIRPEVSGPSGRASTDVRTGRGTPQSGRGHCPRARGPGSRPGRPPGTSARRRRRS